MKVELYYGDYSSSAKPIENDEFQNPGKVETFQFLLNLSQMVGI
jgi:hypothetical protein